jgi:hypothetical protein
MEGSENDIKSEGKSTMAGIERRDAGAYIQYINTAIDQEKIRTIIEKLQGYPDSWQYKPQNTNPTDNDQFNPKPGSEFVRTSVFLYDQLPRANFVAKLKTVVTPSQMKERIANNDWSGNYDERTIRALYSLSNEIILGQRIQKIFKDNAEYLKELAEKIGYGTVQLAEPLVGLMEKETGNKIMIYENIRGLPPLFPDEVSSVRDALRKLFENNGIKPTDLLSRQFMLPSFLSIDERKNTPIHLIDIEGYTTNDSSPIIEDM